MDSSIEAIKVWFPGAVPVCFQVFGRWQQGFFIGVCDDRQQAVIPIICISATPVGFTITSVTFDRTRSVDKLHRLKKSTLCDGERTRLVISCSKADRHCVNLLPVL